MVIPTSPTSPSSETTNTNTSALVLSLPPTLHHFAKTINNLVKTQLTDTNFDIWKNQVQTGLLAYDLLSYVDGSFPIPPREQTSPAIATTVSNINPSYLTWLKIDATLKSCIIPTISETIQTGILSLSHMFQIWQQLHTRFATFSQTHVLNIKFEIHHLEKQSSENMNQYLNRARDLHNQLLLAGSSIPADDLAFHVLAGLPAEYKPLTTTIRARTEPLTVDSITSLLVSEELILSTAGGAMVPGANVFGNGDGTAKGGSPKARVASYKVCWPAMKHVNATCLDADILAAFDNAIHDGVDVLSLSVGGPPGHYFDDSIAIGSFHAVSKGITVVCSAGNEGPEAGSVSNVAPWIITVGASTMDREFDTFVHLKSGLELKGTSVSKALPTKNFYTLLTGEQGKASNASETDAMLCEEGTLDPKKVKGKILVCLRGVNDRVDKGEQARRAGAVGMILCNDEASGNEIIADTHVIPSSHLTYKDGQAVFAYINSSSSPTGSISPTITKVNSKPAPFMAAFSSQGPNTITPEILKPDITAPGVNVIAACTEATSPTGEIYDHRRTAYNTMSGTSMSCPHVSGIVGLLKTLHPEWSPAAIRSAIMTSSRTRDNTVNPMQNSSFTKATPFSYGAGHIRPNRAMYPGLIYDLTVRDYLTFLCASGYNETMLAPFNDGAVDDFKCPKSASLLDLNYPSITVPKLSGSVTVTRRVRNVGKPGKYVARLIQPRGVQVIVKPNVMTFKDYGEEHTFKLTFEAKNAALHGSKDYSFGGLIWSDGAHYVRSSIVVARA